MLKEFWDDIGKYMAILIVGLTLLLTLAEAISAHYQSQVTGYSFAQCFWAGDTIKTINLKK